MKLSTLFPSLSPSPTMPVMFVGHGSPMFAITNNPYRRVWQQVGQRFDGSGKAGHFPRPQLIVCVSAHWQTRGWGLTGMASPKTIHDFGGFPQALFDQQYPAPGHPAAVREIAAALGIGIDESHWGFDHGTWSVLMNMFPVPAVNALVDIPVVQLSLNALTTQQQHFEFAKQLAPLREHGVLIVGSGQVVHNLRLMDRTGLFEENPAHRALPPAYDWALAFDDFVRDCIAANTQEGLAELANFEKLGRVAQLAHPSTEHYLPLLYPAACVRDGESHEFFNDVIDAGSMALRSVLWS